MHHPQVIDEQLRLLPPRLRHRRKRARVPVDALAHEKLFLLLTTLRAASADSLFALFFKPAGVKHRTAMRRLHDLVAAGYLGHLRLEGARAVYHLTPKALGLTPRLRLRATSSLGTPPQDRQAMYCWLRSAVWASLRADGWTVGRAPDDIHALRRVLVDAAKDRLAQADPRDNYWAKTALENLRGARALQVPFCRECTRCAWRCSTSKAKPRTCPKCFRDLEPKVVKAIFACSACRAREPVLIDEPHTTSNGNPCTGAWRKVDASAFDIAWRRSGASYEAMVVLVDDPSRSVSAQIDELPFTGIMQPRLRMIIRTTDAHSVLDRKSMNWLATGRRRAEFLAAIEKKKDVVDLVEYRPDLEAYFAR